MALVSGCKPSPANTYPELGTMVPLDIGPNLFARRAYEEFGVTIWTSSQATTAYATSPL